MGVAFAAAVHQISASLAQTLHGKRWTGAVTQQSLQPCTVSCCDAHPGIDREATAVATGRCSGGHVFGITRLEMAACHKGAQDAFAHVGLHLGDGGLIESSRRLKNHTARDGLKHPIAHAHMEVHMRVQAGAKAVDARRPRPGADCPGQSSQRRGNGRANLRALRAGRYAVPR